MPFTTKHVRRYSVPLLLRMNTKNVRIKSRQVTQRTFRQGLVRNSQANRKLLVLMLNTTFHAGRMMPTVSNMRIQPFSWFRVNTTPSNTNYFQLRLRNLSVRFDRNSTIRQVVVFARIPNLLRRVLTSVNVVRRTNIRTRTVSAS